MYGYLNVKFTNVNREIKPNKKIDLKREKKTNYKLKINCRHHNLVWMMTMQKLFNIFSTQPSF